MSPYSGDILFASAEKTDNLTKHFADKGLIYGKDAIRPTRPCLLRVK